MDESNHHPKQNAGEDDVDQPAPAPLPQYPQEHEVADNSTAQQEYPHKRRFRWPFAKTFRTRSRLMRWRRFPVKSLDNLGFWRPAKRASPQTISNVFLVLFTAGLFGTSYLQWDTLRATLEQTEKAATAANRQAKAAQDANDLTREAQRQANDLVGDADRPWIGVYQVTLINYAPEKKAGARLQILNSGRTPGLAVTPKISIMIVPGIPLGPPDYAYPRPYQSQPVVFPNQTVGVTILLPDPLSSETFIGLTNGAFSLKFWGTITYADRFQKSHTTTICEIFNIQLHLTEFTFCTHGNTADQY